MAKIIILANHHAVASGRYMLRAFKRLGHDVRSMGEPKGNSIWGIAVDARHEWTPDYPSPDRLRGFWQPDLVLQMDTEITYADKVCPNVPHAIFTVDNHVRDVVHGGYPRFDKYFLAHHDGPARPVCEDCGHVWLPCAYDDEVFTPSPIPMAERKYDVAIVGVPYERRQRIVSLMQDAGLNVYAGLGPLYEEYRDVYHNAKISLCVSAAGDVAQRVFETAAMGCVVLSDPLKDARRLGMQPFNSTSGIGACNYYEYQTDADAVAVAKLLIGDNIGLLEMAGNIGQDWARPHTWIARAQTILDITEIK